MNKVTMIGNLTADPQTIKTKNDKLITTFTIAVDRRFTGEEKQVDFFKVKAFGNLANIISEYVGKGSKIAVDGVLQTTEWTDNDGVVRRGVEIIADEVEFIHTRKKEEEHATGNRRRRN